jgi:hypothetical protein
MGDLATALAIAFAIPLSLLVGLCAWLVCYWTTSTAAAGTVTFVSVRLWIDDDTAPADRYFASVRYAVQGVEHIIERWGPHAVAPSIGRPVTIRYCNAEPSRAVVWEHFTRGRVVLLAIAFVICAAAEGLALRAVLG